MLTDYDVVKISGLPQVVTPSPSDELPMNNAGVTGKANPSQLSADYKSLLVMPSSIEALGNRSYRMIFTGVDYSTLFSPGARLRAERSVPAQVQSTSLNGTNQYFNKTGTINGINFTDDFVVGAWVKLSSYAACSVISRYNGTSGWDLRLESDGRVALYGFNGGAGNFSGVTSYQNLPLNKWVYIALQNDMSAFTATPTTCFIMIDGADVPVITGRGGTNPTALVQAGNLELGSRNAGSFFPGKIAQAFVSSAKITQANIRKLYSQGLTPALISAHNIASAYSFDGNSNDLNTTNANNLSPQNGAATNNADGPFGIQAGNTLSTTIEHCIVMSNTVSGGNTTTIVQVPEGGALPTSGGLSALAYASVKTPYGFPGAKDRWRLETVVGHAAVSAILTVNGVWVAFPLNLTVPVGEWDSIGFKGTINATSSGSNSRSQFYSLSSTVPANYVYNQLLTGRNHIGPVTQNNLEYITVEGSVSLTTQTVYTLYAASDVVTPTESASIRGDQGVLKIFAENSLL